MPETDTDRVGTSADDDARARLGDPSLYGEADADDPPGYLGGLPEGYYVSHVQRSPWGGRPREWEVTPQYREGDQFSIYTMSPDQVANLQRSMIRAGLLDPEDVEAFGYVGPASVDSTFDAYVRVLEFANQAGYASAASALEALQRGGFGTGPGGTIGGAKAERSGGGGGGRLPSTISNADDLRRVFRASVIDTLGEGWSESQIDGMVQAYQALERGQVAQAEQLALDAATRSMESGEVVSPGTIEALPDAATFAAQQARDRDPVGAQARDWLGVANQFMSMLGEWNPSAGEMPGLDR